LGDSVSVSGACLTVILIAKPKFQVEATKQTVESTNISGWHSSTKVNLERALKVGDRFGGHMVQGHIDGTGKITKVRYMAGSNEYSVEVPNYIRELVVSKGSITIDGVSLTIVGKTKLGFKLMTIPFTLENTTLGVLKPGEKVNIETDIVFRWLAERYPQNHSENNGDAWDANSTNITEIYRED
jgi:riboflavin synthase